METNYHPHASSGQGPEAIKDMHFFTRSRNTKLYTVCTTKEGSKYWLNWDMRTFEKFSLKGMSFGKHSAQIISAVSENEILKHCTLKNIRCALKDLSELEQFSKIKVGSLLYVQGEDEYWFSSKIEKIEIFEVNEEGAEKLIVSTNVFNSYPKVQWNPIEKTAFMRKMHTISW